MQRLAHRKITSQKPLTIIYFDNIKSSWSLSKATSNTAWLCDTFEYSDQSSGADAFLKACYEINQAGDILDGKINMPSTLEAKNIDLILKK